MGDAAPKIGDKKLLSDLLEEGWETHPKDVKDSDKLWATYCLLPVEEEGGWCGDPEWSNQLEPPFKPILVTDLDHDPYIIDGNHRYVAAQRLGLTEIPAWRVDDARAD